MASLGGLLAGAYNIDAFDGAERTGMSIRGQLTPGETQAFLADVTLDGQNIGQSFVTITRRGAVVANAVLEGVVGDTITFVDSSNATIASLSRVAGSLFSSGAPSPLAGVLDVASGISLVANF